MRYSKEVKEMDKVEQAEMPRTTEGLYEDSPVLSRRYMQKTFRVGNRKEASKAVYGI